MINKTARNERRKITATAANNIAVSLIVTGIIVPTVTLAYQMTLPQTTYWLAFAILWLASGIAMHVMARYLLGGIEE